MEHTRSYSVKGVLAALGKSLLYLLFFIMAQFLTGVVYTAAVAVRTALAHEEMDVAEAAQLAAERLLAGAPAVALLANVFVVAVLLLWFQLRHKPLGKAAGLRRCSGWTAAFSAFAALGLFVAINLALALLPEAWLTAYNADMAPIASTGLFTALSIVVVGPLAEELVFRGIIQTRLLRAMPPWTAVVLQAVLFGIIHGTPIQIVYALLLGLALGFLRSRTGSILPGFAAHAAFNAMNDPLGLLGGGAGSWYALAVMAAVCAAGCVLCRRGLAALAASPEREQGGPSTV